MKSVTAAPFVLLGVGLAVFGADGYQKPPQAVLDILNSPATPTLTLNPTNTYAMQGAPSATRRSPSSPCPCDDSPESVSTRLTNGLHNATFNSTLTLRKIPEGTEIKIALPPNPKLSTGALEPRRQTFRLHQFHRERHRYLGGRSRHRQDPPHRRVEGQRRVRRLRAEAAVAAAPQPAAQCNGWPTARRCWFTRSRRIADRNRPSPSCPPAPTCRRAWAADKAW